MTYVLLWMVFMAATTFAGFLVAPTESQAIYRKRIREVRLRSADPEAMEEERLRAPFLHRVLAPLLGRFVRELEKITPTGLAERLAQRLRRAGQPMTLGGFILFKGLLAAALAGVFVLMSAGREAMGLAPGDAFFLVAALVLGWMVPDFWIGRRTNVRRQELSRALPDVLDLLSVSVEAGLGFDGAIQKVSEKFSDPTASEFAEYLKEVRLGKTREEALRNLVARADLDELKSFAAAVIQADRLGVSLARVLRIQSAQLRTQRMQRAEEKAMQTPIKMVFPLVFFIFPTIFVVLLGPAAIHFIEMMGTS